MVAESRWTTHPQVVVDCPRCLRPLPPVVVDCDARASGLRMLSFTLTVQELDAAWWDAARAGHPTCLPPHTYVRPLSVPGGAGGEVLEG
jgi:hypothetical protein